MSFAQQIVTDLGVNGQTPNVYAKLKSLEDAIQDIQSATTQLVNGSGAGAAGAGAGAGAGQGAGQGAGAGAGQGAGAGAGQNQQGLAQGAIERLSQFLNAQAQQAGLQQTLSVKNLSAQEAKDMEKVNDKLEEINAKIDALREALNVQDVVVKSYYESGD
jgi:hypothetical protein